MYFWNLRVCRTEKQPLDVEWGSWDCSATIATPSSQPGFGLRDVLPPGSKHLRAFPPQLALPYHEEKGDHMLKCRTVCCPFTCIKSIMPLIHGWCSMAFLKAHYNQWIGHNRYRTKTSTKKLTWKKNKLHWLDHFQTGLHNSFTSPAFSVCCRGVDTKQHCSDIQDL